MKLKVAWVGRTKEAAIDSLTQEYLKRISRFAQVEGISLRDEDALLQLRKRTNQKLVLLDSRGKQLSSEEFASFLGEHESRGSHLLFAVGPADGFSDHARRAADSTLSLGKITLAHELARVVLLEQIYRGFTILKGHPYHQGH